ncbi:MAG: hypothetical protein A3K03_04540 [Bdellovibrionales bacterium RIFOXYD1_FULL_44_7]|nr:MAG: hypothetical protein A3K03_04540 [Bdellovibrionales bacterium RIFOXYD1_FULL_44_7]
MIRLTPRASILLVEDEPNLSNSLSIILENEGFEVKALLCGRPVAAEFTRHDLTVLDLMLPDISGLEVLEAIRKTSPSHPVIILSAKNDEDDIVRGLSLGADDYVTKPFSIKELTTRIHRALERVDLYKNVKQASPVVKIGSKCSIDFAGHSAITMDGKISLTNQELNVLSYMISNEGRLVSRKELLEKTWGYSSGIETRTVDNFIARFRKYFEKNPKKPSHFITKRGTGYVFYRSPLDG